MNDTPPCPHATPAPEPWMVAAANDFILHRVSNVSRQFDQLAAIIQKHAPTAPLPTVAPHLEGLVERLRERRDEEKAMDAAIHMCVGGEKPSNLTVLLTDAISALSSAPTGTAIFTTGNPPPLKGTNTSVPDTSELVKRLEFWRSQVQKVNCMDYEEAAYTKRYNDERQVFTDAIATLRALAGRVAELEASLEVERGWVKALTADNGVLLHAADKTRAGKLCHEQAGVIENLQSETTKLAGLLAEARREVERFQSRIEGDAKIELDLRAQLATAKLDADALAEALAEMQDAALDTEASGRPAAHLDIAISKAKQALADHRATGGAGEKK